MVAGRRVARKSLPRELQRFAAKKQLIELNRKPIADEHLQGYVVGVGLQFVLLHILDDNMILNGYSAIRLSDIRGSRHLADKDRFAERALELRRLGPIPLPSISLDSLPELLITGDQNFPMITIHREKMSTETCYIGKIAKLTDKTLMLDEIDTSAKWSRMRRYRLADITRVDIGGLYEEALLLVAESRTQNSSRRRC